MKAQKKQVSAQPKHTAQSKRSGPSKRTASRPRALTAQPRPLSDDIGVREPTEEGLSIEPEEMGQSFLRYAIEQNNYETQRGAGAAELTPDGEPGTDEALDSPNFSPEASVWSNTVDVATSAGRIEDVARSAEPSPPSDLEETWEEGDEERRPQRGVMEIDLTESVIDEASLLDEESDVLGEVIPKEPRTEDAHHKSKPPR